MHLVEAVVLLAVLKDDEAAGVGADGEVVLLGSSEAEGDERANGAEDIDGVESDYLARVVGAEELE
jgi:hypothetical protein